jgi:hypothetical protein
VPGARPNRLFLSIYDLLELSGDVVNTLWASSRAFLTWASFTPLKKSLTAAMYEAEIL